MEGLIKTHLLIETLSPHWKYFMQLNVSGHHEEVTDALRDYVSTKLARVARRFDKITNVKVIHPLEKQRPKAESTMRISGSEIYAASEHESL